VLTRVIEGGYYYGKKKNNDKYNAKNLLLPYCFNQMILSMEKRGCKILSKDV